MKRAVEERLRRALAALNAPLDTEVEVSVTKDPAFGDLSTPVAMALAKKLGRKPRDIAQELSAALLEADTAMGRIFEKAEVAGPGFINLTLTRAFLLDSLRPLVTGDVARPNLGGGKSVQVEFVSANPTGPLHLGHGRGAAVGAALSNVLGATGYRVTREYYVNDAGRQVKLLAESVFARYKEMHALQYPLPEEGYKGEYVREIAEGIASEVGDKYKDAGFAEAEGSFTQYALQKMLGEIKGDLATFGVVFDTWQSERELYSSGSVGHALEFLKERGLIYESEGALWFRAAEFGDEKDRVVVKSGGEHTYFASDIAYHLKKAEAGYDELINIWGADHHGYVPRLEAVLDALGYGRERLRVLLVQMVSVSRAGKPVAMSKRAGEFVTLKEIMEEIGADTTKFIFLTRRQDSHLSFDLDLVKKQSAENPVFYVQYANARINSIMRHAGEQGVDTGALGGADLALLASDAELGLIKKLLQYPMALEQASKNREPHRLTFYLQELAGMFHPFYNTHRVVTEDAALSAARLALVAAIRNVLKDGLIILGLTAPDRM